MTWPVWLSGLGSAPDWDRQGQPDVESMWNTSQSRARANRGNTFRALSKSSSGRHRSPRRRRGTDSYRRNTVRFRVDPRTAPTISDPEQDVVGRDDLQQQVDAGLMVDARIEEDVMADPTPGAAGAWSRCRPDSARRSRTGRCSSRRTARPRPGSAFLIEQALCRAVRRLDALVDDARDQKRSVALGEFSRATTELLRAGAASTASSA